MESVFNRYQVCDDVREIIARKVHEKNQEEINRHISVIIGWDEEYDYWKFFGEIVSTSYLIEHVNKNFEISRSEKVWFEKKIDLKYLDFIEFEYNNWKTKTKFKTFNIDINRSDFKNDHSVFLNFLNLFFKH